MPSVGSLIYVSRKRRKYMDIATITSAYNGLKTGSLIRDEGME